MADLEAGAAIAAALKAVRGSEVPFHQQRQQAPYCINAEGQDCGLKAARWQAGDRQVSRQAGSRLGGKTGLQMAAPMRAQHYPAAAAATAEVLMHHGKKQQRRHQQQWAPGHHRPPIDQYTAQREHTRGIPGQWPVKQVFNFHVNVPGLADAVAVRVNAQIAAAAPDATANAQTAIRQAGAGLMQYRQQQQQQAAQAAPGLSAGDAAAAAASQQQQQDQQELPGIDFSPLSLSEASPSQEAEAGQLEIGDELYVHRRMRTEEYEPGTHNLLWAYSGETVKLRVDALLDSGGNGEVYQTTALNHVMPGPSLSQSPPDVTPGALGPRLPLPPLLPAAPTAAAADAVPLQQTLPVPASAAPATANQGSAGGSNPMRITVGQQYALKVPHALQHDQLQFEHPGKAVFKRMVQRFEIPQDEHGNMGHLAGCQHVLSTIMYGHANHSPVPVPVTKHAFPTPVVLMQLAKGGSLYSQLKKQSGRRFNSYTTWLIMKIMTKGLSGVHARGMIHGDVKPGNALLLEKDNLLSLVLSDFGNSMSVPEGGYLPAHYGPTCTFGYRCPEQLRGQPFGFKTDTCGLGGSFISLRLGVEPWASAEHGSEADPAAAAEFRTPGGVLNAYGTALLNDGKESSLTELSMLTACYETEEKRPTAEQLLMHPYFSDEFGEQLWRELRDETPATAGAQAGPASDVISSRSAAARWINNYH